MGMYQYCDNCGEQIRRHTLREALGIDTLSCPHCYQDQAPDSNQYADAMEEVLSRLESVESALTILDSSPRREKVLELCAAVENEDELPSFQFAHRHSTLIKEVRALFPSKPSTSFHVEE